MSTIVLAYTLGSQMKLIDEKSAFGLDNIDCKLVLHYSGPLVKIVILT